MSTFLLIFPVTTIDENYLIWYMKPKSVCELKIIKHF